jgi:hypothetical protein
MTLWPGLHIREQKGPPLMAALSWPGAGYYGTGEKIGLQELPETLKERSRNSKTRIITGGEQRPHSLCQRIFSCYRDETRRVGRWNRKIAVFVASGKQSATSPIVLDRNEGGGWPGLIKIVKAVTLVML